MNPKITIIAAFTWQGRILSIDGKMPWHPIPEEMNHFRFCTMNKPVIMGRKTYEAIGKPLERRHNIVMTRNPNFYAPHIGIVGTLQRALTDASHSKEVLIIGGASIYRLFLPFATKMILTYLHDEYDEEGHEITRFPVFEENRWKLVHRELYRDSAFWVDYLERK